MKNSQFLGLFIILAIGFVTQASAYGYQDYKNEYYQKTSYDYNGYSYVEKQTQSNPWGETTTYTKITDNNGYSNRALNYWSYGPQTGYSHTKYYLNYDYDDAWRRTYYGTQYHPYYYKPYYNGNHYDWKSRYYCDGRYCAR